MRVITGIRFVERNYDSGGGLMRGMRVLQQQVTECETPFGCLMASTSTWEDVPTVSDSTGGES